MTPKNTNKDTDQEIKQLKDELKKKDASIESLKKQLLNNQSMLKDIIAEKKLLKKHAYEYELSMTDAKLKQYQKLQEDHQKIVHRLSVTKNYLDTANKDIKDLKEEVDVLRQIVSDLNKRGLLDFIRGRYPDSYRNYQKRTDH